MAKLEFKVEILRKAKTFYSNFVLSIGFNNELIFDFLEIKDVNVVGYLLFIIINMYYKCIYNYIYILIVICSRECNNNIYRNLNLNDNKFECKFCI